MRQPTPAAQTAEEYGEELASDRFLSSHRALAACSREFGRLADEIAQRVEALRSETLDEKPEIRLAPGRYIVQFGPVALTLAWLRSTLDSVADGKLLVMAWQGKVGGGPLKTPERAGLPRTSQTPVVLWEETLVASGASEAGWLWQREGDSSKRYESQELATRCVKQLRDALAAHRT